MGCHRDSPLLGRWHAIGVALGKRGKRSGEKEKGPLEGSLNQRVTWKKETRLSAVSAGVAGRGEGGGLPRLLFSIDLPSPPYSSAARLLSPLLLPSLLSVLAFTSWSLLSPPSLPPSPLLPFAPLSPARPYLLFVTATTRLAT